jgi:hypothetical protein
MLPERRTAVEDSRERCSSDGSPDSQVLLDSPELMRFRVVGGFSRTKA